MKTDEKLNGFSFSLAYAKGKKWDEFYTHYRNSAFTDKDEATQKAMLQEAYDIINPKEEKKR